MEVGFSLAVSFLLTQTLLAGVEPRTEERVHINGEKREVDATTVSMSLSILLRQGSAVLPQAVLRFPNVTPEANFAVGGL